MCIIIQYDNVVNGNEVDTNDVDIQVVSLEETDGLIIEEIDITINEAGNCNCIFLRYICIETINQCSHRLSKMHLIFISIFWNHNTDSNNRSNWTNTGTNWTNRTRWRWSRTLWRWPDNSCRRTMLKE